jgi:aminomuconate-semialdehyde/2-hydroxymuconate-6-semialdehyde dehydrogenase
MEATIPTPLTAQRRIHHFINGNYTAAADGAYFEKRSPLDGSLVALVAEAGVAEVDDAVFAAKTALRGPWGKLTVNERVQLLYSVADEIMRRFDDFLVAEVTDTGKPVSLARTLDIPRAAENFKIFADIIKNNGSEFFQTPTHDRRSAINYSVRSPVGVVAVICPWNFPLLLATWKIGPALASGNTVVVKPSEETPQTAALLGEVMNKVGVPPGVYNVVQGFGARSAGEILAKHPGVDAITFTGETATGAEIMKAAAVGARPVSLELGGKNPSIVFADCDFESAVSGIVRSVFDNCGQVCLGTERVYVERPLFQAFVDELARRVRDLKPGLPDSPGVNLGPLISLKHREEVLSFYRLAKEEGASVVSGGGIPDMPEALREGAWIEPTIWTGLPDSSRVIREEIFGPCCHIATFDDEAEVVRRANDSPYGLCASIWTRDLATAHRMAEAVEAGVVWVNSWFLRDLRTPFGGSKRSGIGREGGVHSLEFYKELKNVCVKL